MNSNNRISEAQQIAQTAGVVLWAAAPKVPSQPRQFAVTIAVRSWWLSGLCKGRTH